MNANNTVGCDDGNACTQSDSCQAGVCTGSNPVTCTASDQCHDVGVCDTGTGQCSDSVVADGTPCDDGDSCTTADTCTAGECLAGIEDLACRCGDLTEDGEITAADALSTLQAAVGLTVCDVSRCDTNADGQVTAADALKLLQYAVGLDVTLNCGVALVYPGSTSTTATTSTTRP